MRPFSKKTRISETTSILGKKGENLARKYLQEKKLKTIQSNYRCKAGEIDLIMDDEQHLVFVEVKLRTHAHFGCPQETVSIAKQKRLIKAAQHYLLYNPSARPCRFDVVAIDSRSKITWIKNAFITDY